MYIREAENDDLYVLLDLYSFLKDKPETGGNAQDIWRRILADTNQRIFIGFDDDIAVCTCVLVIIPNLTHSCRPYAVIENVVTHPGYRGKGRATAVLDAAKAVAAREGCYKIMLMTGSKKESTLNFYRKAGYNSEDKTAFIQWLD